MAWQTSRQLGPLLRDLLQPEKQLLPEYSRQVPAGRAFIRKLLGLIAVILVGAAYGRFFAVLPPQQLLMILAPLAVMALLVIWVLPDRDTAPTATMTKLLLAFLAVSIAWPDYMALQLPGLPWISFRRLFLGPMCLLLLVSVSTSAEFRRQMRETLNAEPLLWKLLLGFIAMQCASIVGGSGISQSFKNFVNYQLAWTGVFFAAAYAFRNAEATTRFFKIFCCACMIIGLVAILENRNEAVLWRNHVPTFLQVDLETMSGTLDSPRRDGFFRAKSVYGQPLPFAEIMAMVTPVILYFMFTVKNVWKRVGFVILDVLTLYVLTLPQSRLGILGFLVAHGLFILVWSGRVWLRSRSSIIGPMITLAYPVLLIGVAGAVMSVGSLRERVIGSNSTIYSDQARKIQKRSARGVILRNPVLGHGPRSAAGTLGFEGGGRVTLDNYFIWIALDYGMIGFFFFYGMLLLAIHRMFMLSIKGVGRDNNQALAIMTMLSVFILIKTVLSEEDNHSVMFMALGMVAALMWRQQEIPVATEAELAAISHNRVFSPR